MKNKYSSQMTSQRTNNRKAGNSNLRYKEDKIQSNSKTDVGIEAFQSIDDDQYNDNILSKDQTQN